MAPSSFTRHRPLPPITWPKPPQLKGYKSVAKPVFKAAAGEVQTASGRVIAFADISLSLESRVLALGEAGYALSELLLRRRPPLAGEISHNAELVIVHLCPPIARLNASREEHAAMISFALQTKPHIVVLDEALLLGSETWIQTFDEVLYSEELQCFRGAVVVCCAKELPGPPCHRCTTRWIETPCSSGKLRQEPISRSRLEVVEDVSISLRLRSNGDRDVAIEPLVEEARELSDHCFEEDILEAAAEDGDTVTLLTLAVGEGERRLLGYICYRYYEPPRAEIYISRLAVCRKQRGCGYAKLLVQWLIGKAARLPQSKLAWVTLGALANAVSFYAKLGFLEAPARESPKEGSDPQTWMELPNVSVLRPMLPADQEASNEDAAPDSVQATPPVSPVRPRPPELEAAEVAVIRPGARALQEQVAKEMRRRIHDIEKKLKKRNVDADALLEELETLRRELAAQLRV